MAGTRLKVGLWLGAFLAVSSQARAAATLFLEEPYGHLGAFTGTGHMAVYLSRVCASSPTSLRRCRPGEAGAVLSRYDHVAGYDWLAVPLIPYLYAVDYAEDVPLFADANLVSFLRNRYRHEHLAGVAPDTANGVPPDGNWTQLVGAAYDRTIYAFEVATSAEKDDELIQQFDSAPNRTRFHSLSRNCADFARSIVNFYYPHAVHRDWIADAGITTPKQIAKSLMKFSRHHGAVGLSTFAIPQVPGSMPRSTPVHGVIESLLKTKKYLVPLAVLHPLITGCLAAVYVTEGRFDPGHNAMLLDSRRTLGPAVDPLERRAYLERLNLLLAQNNAGAKGWASLQKEAQPELDPQGRPVLQVEVGQETIRVGVSRANLLSTRAPAALTQELMMARLQHELLRSEFRKTPMDDVESDWKILETALPLTSENGPGVHPN
jgi:hypothetical protein